MTVLESQLNNGIGDDNMKLFEDVRLVDLLILFVRDDTHMMHFNILNTNNDSFPDKYRSNWISASSLFTRLYKGPDHEDTNMELLNRKIKFINILPTTSSITDTKFNIPITYDYEHGFGTPKINEETGEEYMESIGFVLHVVLETD